MVTAVEEMKKVISLADIMKVSDEESLLLTGASNYEDAYCVKNGYKIVTDGIEGIAGFWDNGIRYFKIASPTGEQFEFCQIL